MSVLRAGMVVGQGIRHGFGGGAGAVPIPLIAGAGMMALAHAINVARKTPALRSTKTVLKMLGNPASINQGVRAMETLGRRGHKLPRKEWMMYNKYAEPGSTKFSRSLPGGEFYEATPMEKLDIATYGKKKKIAGGLGIGALVAKLLHGQKDAE